MIRSIMLATCFFGVLLASNTAKASHQIDIKLCLWSYVDLNDTNPGYEDYGFGKKFYGDAWFWRLRRMEAVVRDYWTGDVVWEAAPNGESWLDSYGCTEEFTVDSGQYIYADLVSHGAFPNGNTLEVHHENGGVMGYYSNLISVSESGDYDVIFDYDDDVLRLWAMASQSMLSFSGQMAGQTIKIRNGRWPTACDFGLPRACSDPANDRGYISLGDAPTNRRKFVLAHEYGHLALCLTGNCKPRNCKYPDGVDQHSFLSAEYSSCAAMEGWAYFVETDVWNYHGGSNPDGWMERGMGDLVSIDIPASGSSYINRYRNCNHCSSLSNCGRYGTDLDWTRHFWDYHTDNYSSAPGYPTTHSQLQDDVGDASWDFDTAYQGIGYNIWALRGSEQRDRYIYFGDFNGCSNSYTSCAAP